MRSFGAAVVFVFLGIASTCYGNFEKVFEKASVLDKPAGTGKILIQSELKIEVLHLPDACEKKAALGQTLVFDFELKVNDEVLESSYEETKDGKEPVKLIFPLGKRYVVPGIESGAINMCIGEKRKLIIPPHLAYGEAGVPDFIPKNAILHVEMELLEIMPQPWSEWYTEMVQMACVISFVGGFFVMIFQGAIQAKNKKRQGQRRRRSSDDVTDDEHED